ncbi:MAG: retropepsin-like aspartic protease [Candidatus Aminicenantaceae bacterium]
MRNSLPGRRAPFGFAVLWVFSALILLLTQTQAQTFFPELQRLYSSKRYFELRDRLKKIGEDNRSPELEFFRGAVDNVFNRLPSSLTHLLGYLERTGGSQPAIWARECYDLLADSYRKSFQYARAAEINEKILILFRNELSDTERADHENEFKLWEALKDTPAQTAEFTGDTTMQMQSSHVPMTVNGFEIALTYDTGADLSVLIASLAKKLGLEIIDVPIRVGTITGEKIDARVGVAADLRIGNMTVHHALFLVMKDEYFYIPEIEHQIQGVLGFPVLAAMREVTFSREGEIRIPSSPRTQGEQNLALDGFKPLIEGHHAGKRLTFVLDTGANRSDLWPPFLTEFKDEVEDLGELITERFRGVGSRREVKAYSLRDLVLQVSGRDVTFRRIPVFTEYTTENSRFFYGNLGQDLVRQFQSMTINFENMCVVFN